MITYLHDGIEFDLTVTYRDCTNVEWEWAGTWSAAGEPLMRERVSDSDRQGTVSLPDLYHYHGPLIPLHPRPTASQYRAAIDPNYADTLASGYIESPAAFGARIAPPALVPTPAVTLPQAPGRILAPSPLEQTGFRRFLSTLTGGRNA
ncbi:phiSA1p31-related protein [Streptomyces sp. NPDC005775]|uniref:phiSA1p31-related protein n=1 Tax=Streptomyces sp. NPDC005775 TaxID=3364729 RepID=UPI0036ADBFD8